MTRTVDDLLSAIARGLGQPGAGLDLESGIDVTEGWDSLKNMEVMLQVEAEFKLRFTAQELLSLQTARGIYQCLKARQLID